MTTDMSRKVFEERSNIIFHQNPSSGSRGVPYGPTDMTKLIVASRNFRTRLKRIKNRASKYLESGISSRFNGVENHIY